MDKDLERKRILVIEESSLAIKNLLSQSVLLKENKAIIRSKCISIINDTEKRLKELEVDKEFIDDTIGGLKSSFLRWYNQIVASLEQVVKTDKLGIVSQTLKSLKGIKTSNKTNGFVIGGLGDQVGMEQIQITNIRELMTIYDEGSAGRYVDYVGKIKEAMIGIQDQLASNSLSLYDSKGRQKSIRNMAEIKTRYDLINEDLEKIKAKGSKYVIATAHANASERCSWWQGKIFLIDIDIATRKMGQYPGRKPNQKILGYIDGKPYYSLKEACENGFLSFNCQHRVIAYYKGVHVPQYNIIEVKKRRDISQKQRYLENRIRQEKTKQVLAVTPEERKKAQLRSKELQKQYASFCEVNDTPRYDWRTRVTEVERGTIPVIQKQVEIEFQKSDIDSYVSTNVNGEYNVSFQNKNFAKMYAHEQDIRLKKDLTLEQLNSNIATTMNLRKVLKPIRPDERLKDYLGDKSVMIHPIDSTDKREGTAVHIVNDDHTDMYTDKEKLKTLTTNLDEQEVLALGVTKNDRNEDRFVYVIKANENHATVLVIDNRGGKLEMVTAYGPKLRKAKKSLKKCCIIFNDLV